MGIVVLLPPVRLEYETTLPGDMRHFQRNNSNSLDDTPSRAGSRSDLQDYDKLSYGMISNGNGGRLKQQLRTRLTLQLFLIHDRCTSTPLCYTQSCIARC